MIGIVVVVVVVMVVAVAVIALVFSFQKLRSGVTRMAHHQSSDGLELSPHRWKCFPLGAAWGFLM